MSEAVIQQIEGAIKRAQSNVDLGKSLERLYSNRDFKAVILSGYLEKEAIRLVHVKQHPDLQKPEQQASIVRQLDAIGALSEYLRLIEHFAAQAQKEIAGHQETIDEIRAESLESDE